ncbi:MAG: DUF5367 family protein [Cyclobacteriaceae bacterium]
MKTLKVFLIGSLIWLLGASIYSASYFIPILEDLELQANIILAIGLIPAAWFGAGLYFKKEHNYSGVKVGVTMVLTAIALDAIITVPYLIIPYGGSYMHFFTAPAFWLIAMEYFIIIVLYSRLKTKRN